MAEAPTPRDRIEAASVAMIHECRRLKIAPGKVGSAGQWGLLARAAIAAADASENSALRTELAWACDTIDRLVGESLTKLNARGRARLAEAADLVSGNTQEEQAE